MRLLTARASASIQLSAALTFLMISGGDIGSQAFVLSPFGGKSHCTSSSSWSTSCPTFSFLSNTRLYYIDEEQNNNPNNNNNNQDKPQVGKNTNPVLTIPVLGPVPGNKPLVVGGELVLTVPTPLQWHTLEEAMHLHQAHLTNSDSNVAGIDSAPLVAILDDYTGQSTANTKEGRYATIAAVLGVSTRNNNPKRLDLSDSTTFMESLQRIQRESLPQEGNIRLLGIGRANVYDFLYQVPSSVSCSKNNGIDEDGNILLDDGMFYDDEDYYYEEGDDEDDDDDDLCCGEGAMGKEVPNIVMAKFRLITDGIEHSASFLSKVEGQRSRFASPMHALNEMASLAMKLHYLHLDRIKLVNGIKAAQIRYKRRSQQQQQEEAQTSSNSLVADDEDDLVDYDGFGALFEQKELEATQPALEQFLAEFAPSAAAVDNSSPPSPSSPSDATTATDVVDLKLSDANNYGMGMSASSISSINDMTKAYLEKLSPYYSPARRETEEYYYEVLSFVAVLALSDFIEPKDLGWALCWRNTQERLQQAYEWMWNHVRVLRHDAQVWSQLLLECGEECTGLF